MVNNKLNKLFKICKSLNKTFFILVDQPLNAQQIEQFTTILGSCSINPANVKEILESLNCFYEQNSTYPKYLCYLYYLLFKITSNLCQLQHEEFELKDSEAIVTAVVNCYKFGIKPYREKALNESLINKYIGNVNALSFIIANLQSSAFIQEREIYSIFKELLVCIFTLIPATEQQNQIKCEKILDNFLQKTPTAKLFRTLFLIQADPKVSANEQKVLYKYLTRCLYLPNGFSELCEALLEVHKEDNTRERWHSCTVISNIVGRRGHLMKFYKAVIEEIHSILLKFADGDSSIKESYVEAAVHSLSKLHTLNNRVISEQIESVVLGHLEKIITPEDLLNGTILMEEKELKQTIKIIFAVFCATGPSDVTLPSQLLIPYLPVFFQLHHVSVSVQNTYIQHQLQSIIIRCLSNREKTELNRITEALVFENYSSDMKTIHSTASLSIIEVNNKIVTFSLKVCSSESDTDSPLLQNYDASSTLVGILKTSNHNILTYNIFVHLLHLLSVIFITNDLSQHNIDLFENIEDLMEFIKKNFQRKYSILNSLNELIMHKPLYNQIKSNPIEILDLLNNILKDILKQFESKEHENEQIEEILLMVLSILDELNYKIKDKENQIIKNLVQTLKHLRICVMANDKFDVIAMKLDAILEPQIDIKNPEYGKAFKILSEQSEPYSRVYAMKTISDLLDKRDTETVGNAYSILALSLKILKDKDSYVFLNCIKLFVSLMKVLEASVLDALVTEYQLEGSDEKQVDYKLKIGEAIIKMTEYLGKLLLLMALIN